MTIISIGVHRDGSGHSAYGYERDGTEHRLSPSWVRETFVETLQEFEVPVKGNLKQTTRVKAMKPKLTGHKLVTGESLTSATERAKKALEGLAVGRQPKIPATKEISN